MMAQQSVKQNRCPLCGGTDLSTAQMKRGNGKIVDVPVCQTCAHWIFPDTHYAYLIGGLAKNWHSGEDLRGVIEDILRAYLPPSDVKELQVEVVEIG